MSHCLPGGFAVEPLQQALQQNRALHRSTTQALRPAADVELYSSTALQSALHLYSSTALYTLHPLHPPSGGGMSLPRLRRGRLAGRALSHPFILRGQNKKPKESSPPLRKSMRDLHSFVPLTRRCAGHGLPRGSRSLGLPPPRGWLSTPWVRLVRRCSLAALHKAARSRVAS